MLISLAETKSCSQSSSNKDSEISWLNVSSSVDSASHKQESSHLSPPEKSPRDGSAVEVNGDLEAQKPKESLSAPKSCNQRQWFKVSPRMISDAIIGISDGMTVPFALTAGLASLENKKVVVLGGLAELIAGALSMGLGGFIAAKSEALAQSLAASMKTWLMCIRESYRATVTSTRKMIKQSPQQTTEMVAEVFKPYSLPTRSLNSITSSLQESPQDMLDFLMRFHHQVPEPDTSRPFICAITIGMSYFLGGLVPLIPYFCVKKNEVLLALWWSIGVMAIALFAFGWTKTGVVVGWRGRKNILAGLKGAVQMTLIGGVAAAAAIGLVRAITHGNHV